MKMDYQEMGIGGGGGGGGVGWVLGGGERAGIVKGGVGPSFL